MHVTNSLNVPKYAQNTFIPRVPENYLVYLNYVFSYKDRVHERSRFAVQTWIVYGVTREYVEAIWRLQWTIKMP